MIVYIDLYSGMQRNENPHWINMGRFYMKLTYSLVISNNKRVAINIC